MYPRSQRDYKLRQLCMLAKLLVNDDDLDILLSDLREKQSSEEATAEARARSNLGDLGELPTEAIAMIFDEVGSGDVRPICSAARNVSDTSRTRLIIGKGGGQQQPIIAEPGILLRSPQLKELFVRETVINKGELLLAAATRCRDLRKLVLRWNDLDVAGAPFIAPALEQLTQLRELDLDHDGCHVSSTAVISALAGLNRLQSLRVYFDRDGAAALARCLPRLPELEHLAICCSRFDDDGASVLGPALAQLRSLKMLRLFDKSWDLQAIGPEGVAAISEALGSMRDHLEELHVNCIDGSLLPLASMVHLRILDFSCGEGISPSAIMTALSKLTRLEKLTIYDNHMDPAFRALVVAAVPKACILDIWN